jgi:hypothetical protein
MWFRIRRGKYDNNLIQICNDDPLTRAAAGFASRELREAGDDFRNHPAITAFGFEHPYVVANGKLYTRVAHQLETSAQRCLAQLARIDSDLPDATRT